SASVDVYRNGRRLGVVRSEKRQHRDSLGRPSFQPSTEAGIHSGLKEDLYIVYHGSVEGTEEAVYRFTINPLVWWVWFGGLVLVVGAVIVMWPEPAVVTRGRKTLNTPPRSEEPEMVGEPV
ncbi:MAG: cytochrome c-type biogenesis CcmF C-terminal domain-containing protein, partial [Gemmatimonadales bacterium]